MADFCQVPAKDRSLRQLLQGTRSRSSWQAAIFSGLTQAIKCRWLSQSPAGSSSGFANRVVLAAIVVPAAALARGHDKPVGHRAHPGAIGQRRVQAHFAAVQVPDEEAVARGAVRATRRKSLCTATLAV